MREEIERMQQIVHDLSQPVTALFCVLELAAHSDETQPERETALSDMRSSIELVMEQAQRISAQIVRLRDVLADAQKSGAAVGAAL